MQEKRWKFLEVPENTVTDRLSDTLKISTPLARLLAQRGISTFEEAKAFFRPNRSMVHDPFMMKDMHQAVDRITSAIGNLEKILVYGDYDVDGTTSVAMFFDFLRSFYPNCCYYIPDRHKEGYGVSREGVEWAKENGVSLIITLDCGIKSVELISEARASGIDFIICDHHRPGKSLPPAAAVLDPKREDCQYPFDELSGCGVGFKLIQALCQRHPEIQADPFDYLDLLVVSIASDIVPITGENRVLAFLGLEKLRDSPRPGILALMKISDMTEVTVSNIIFRLAPRINSAGRISHASAAVDMLLAPELQEALAWGEQLQENNQDRKDTDELITREALSMIEADSSMVSARSTVLFKQDWHKGVIGIVASRCIEKYYRPTIILTRKSGNLVTGSARSVHGFDVYNALASCGELLEQYGGHMYAAGMTLREDKVQAFREEFERVVSASINKDLLVPEVIIDTGLNFEEITPKFYRILKQMAPFGPLNLNPVFCTERLIASNVTVLKEKHLKMTVRQEGCSGSFNAIGFGMADLKPMVDSGKSFKMVYCLEENHYRGKTSLQLMVKDIKGIEYIRTDEITREEFN